MPDPTVGQDFVFRVRPLGSDHDVEYRLKRTNTGWDFRHEDGDGRCDKAGRPFLLDQLEQDGVEDTEVVGSRMKLLWLRAWETRLSPGDVQEALNQLADWVRHLMAHPLRGRVWETVR
jgi:hypothetical protein